VIALIRPASANKPFALKLKERGVEVQIGDATDEIEVLIAILKDIDVVISAISAESQLAQLALVTAAKQAGVKRFVPCGFITVAPAGGVMELRDQVLG
jgi:NmrA-like family